MVATLAWIEGAAQLLQTPDNTPFQFEAELLDSTRYDLELSIDLTEPVLALPRGDGSGFDIEHPPEPTLPPMFARARPPSCKASAMPTSSCSRPRSGRQKHDRRRSGRNRASGSALLRTLSSGQRRKLLRKMARDLAASQRQRIAAQRQPDGSAFAPRKQRRRR
jgi:hypothetical protein